MMSGKYEGEGVDGEDGRGSPAIEANSDEEYFSDDENGDDLHFSIELQDQRLIDSNTSKQATIAAAQAFVPDNGMLFVNPVQMLPNSWRMRGQQVDRYFNFGMDEVKWRLYVNKQIFMRLERIFIEHKLQEDKEQHDLNKSKKYMRDRNHYQGYMSRYDAPPYHHKSGGGGYRGRNNYMSHRNQGGRYDRFQGYGGGGGGSHQPLPYPTFEENEMGEKMNRF